MLVLVVLFLQLTSTGNGCKPKQVHLSIGENSNERVVIWSTKPSITQSIVHYGSDPTLLNSTVYGSFHVLKNGKNVQNIHTVVLTGLSSAHKYWYRVGSKGCWSKIYSFRTFRNDAHWSPRLSVFGDLGFESGHSMKKLIHEAKKEEIDAVLHAGDIGYNLCSEHGTLGDKYLDAVEPMAARIPYMVVPGNHEFEGDLSGKNYRKRFAMPGSNDFHSFDLGPVKIVGFSTEAYYMNDTSLIEAQEHYLRKVLTEANRQRHRYPWIIAFGHRPLYCTSAKIGRCNYEADLKHKHLEDIFQGYGVDLVIFGHNHHYERLYPVYKFKTFKKQKHFYENPEAPVYIVSGAAGNFEAMQEFRKKKDFPYSAFRLRKFSYTKLHVHNRTHLYLEQVDAKTDKIHDSLWISQEKHGRRPL